MTDKQRCQNGNNILNKNSSEEHLEAMRLVSKKVCRQEKLPTFCFDNRKLTTLSRSALLKWYGHTNHLHGRKKEYSIWIKSN